MTEQVVKSLSIRLAVMLLLLVFFVLAVSAWALSLGSLQLYPTQIVEALISFDGSREHLIVTQVRLPRVLSALFVGACLSSAGVVMQAIVNNPLASPSLFGINSGATLFVVMAIFFFETTTRSTYVWFAFAGALATAAFVYAAASAGPKGATTFRLLLMGAMITFFAGSLTASVLLLDKGTLGAVQQWTVGSLKGIRSGDLLGVLPLGLVGLFGAVLFERQIRTLGMGDSVARSVGQNVARWRLLAGICVALLAGASVALAGPVGFLGLVMPHLARLIVGNDYRLVLPCAALLGALIVMFSDNVIRILVFSRDVPVGITMAMIGAPFFIYLARFRADG